MTEYSRKELFLLYCVDKEKRRVRKSPLYSLYKKEVIPNLEELRKETLHFSEVMQILQKIEIKEKEKV